MSPCRIIHPSCHSCVLRTDDQIPSGLSALVSGVLLVAGAVGFLILVSLKYLSLKLQQPTVVAPSTKEVSDMANIDTAFLETINNVGAGIVATCVTAALI